MSLPTFGVKARAASQMAQGGPKDVAYFKHPSFFKKDESTEFDKTNSPGTKTPYSGIYRCEHCGLEAVSIKGAPLPPQNHHQHSSYAPISWRLTAATHPA